MKLPGSLVGAAAGPRVHDIDARWVMAYAAALGDMAPEYLDTTRPDGLVSHPLFPVCFEWPLALELRGMLPEAIAVRSVHATHDLLLRRRPRPGDRLSTTATVVSTEPRPPGAYVVTRFETTDAAGLPVCATDYGSIYRGIECERAAVPRGGRAPAGGAALGSGSGAEHRRDEPVPDWSADIAVAATLAHTYTECARIWNPIHTDKAVARSGGLPDIILHGTATLALAVSAILERAALGPAADVARIACRFAGMVPLPSTVTVRGWDEPAGDGRAIGFTVVDGEGRPVIRDGRLVTRGAGGSGRRSA